MEVHAILDSESSRLNFLAGLIAIAKADGVVDEREKVFFKNAAIGLELSGESLRAIESFWDVDTLPPLEFSTMLQKKFFLRSAIELCCIDEHYAEAEKMLVRKFAAEFGISFDTIATIEEWVQRGMLWKYEGDELIKKGE